MSYQPSAMHQKGFTLVELAIVLIIIGLLAGMGAGLVGMLTKRAKLAETRETVKTAYESILGYAASKKKLPNDLSDLGIKTKDSYSADLRYYKVSNLAANNICTSTGTYLSVTDKGTAKNNVAFIVFSDGENKCNQTGTSPFNVYETDAVVACPQDANAGYDDTVMYVDINKLREAVCTSFKVVTEALPTGTEETGYPSVTLEATDGTTPYTWAISSGSLPSGLSLSSDGKITGMPIADGSYNFTVKVEDSDSPKNREATKSLTITINPNDPRITTEFLHYGAKGSPYTASLAATGGAGYYVWGLSSGSLPPGLSLSGSTISGNPTTAGTYSFTIQITDSRGRTTQKTLSIAVN
ncbi:MAG: putative Ig domain-containing protein [Nitrospirae bacterium]|nr:putative Ig domain-containing protein [Nitrospirota bacterium]